MLVTMYMAVLCTRWIAATAHEWRINTLIHDNHRILIEVNTMRFIFSNFLHFAFTRTVINQIFEILGQLSSCKKKIQLKRHFLPWPKSITAKAKFFLLWPKLPMDRRTPVGWQWSNHASCGRNVGWFGRNHVPTFGLECLLWQ